MYLQVNAEMSDSKSLTISPISPQSPTANYATIRRRKAMSAEYRRNKKICKVLRKIGLFKASKIADTLQGK